MNTIEATSIGNVACNLGVTVNRVERLANRLRIKPVLKLDRVPHYTEAQIETMRAALATKESD